VTHRPVLATRQRSALFDLPADEASLLKHYILADVPPPCATLRPATVNASRSVGLAR